MDLIKSETKKKRIKLENFKDAQNQAHTSELLRDAFEELLDGGGVADERGGHLESSWGDVAHGGLHVVRDPFDEV